MALTRSLYQLGFQISPVILTNGLASAIYGGMLPIVALTQTAGYITSLLGGDSITESMDDYFCHWQALPGSTVIDYSIGQYPFANQTVAANALMANPLNLSMLMQAPINSKNGPMAKLATMSALQAALQAHANLGGTFTIATPALFYTNCVLLQVRDVTPSNIKNPQTVWQFDFQKPLITTTDATSAVNSMLSKVDTGDVLTSSSWTNSANALGNTSLGGSVTSLVDQITGLVGQLAS